MTPMWELSPYVVTELAEFLGPGVYAIINPWEFRIDIRHSTNCLEAVVRHFSQLSDGTHSCKEMLKDRDKLRFRMLERIPNLQHRMMAQTYYLNIYQEKGYKFYRFRPALNYRVRIKVENYQVVVRLENSNHDSFVVGVFLNMTEARAFVEQYYSRKVPFPVFACNKETQRYLGR